MSNPPVIPNLPPAPTRSDGPADFTPKADAMMGALQPMVTAENALGAWMNSTASQVAADALFAGQAADRAEAVDTNVSEQVAAAKASADNAAAAAAAAGQGAGFPQDGSVGDVLTLAEGNQVRWGSMAAVAAPSNITPANNAANITTPSFSGSAYYSLYGKTQASRQARMSLSPIFATVLWDSGEIAGVGTTVTGPSLNGLAPTSTLVYWQIRYKDVDGAWSAWSATTSFTTSVQYVPTVAGTAYGGGFYAGRMKIGADSYALIVAPKASGESASLTLKTSQTTTAGTTSTWDGAANTAAMIAAGAAAHPAANFCKGLSIGGYTDWVLPAKDQLELLYRQLKPDATANNTSYGANPSSDPVGANYTAGAPAQTAIAAFRTGGAEAFAVDSYYWTSTEFSSTFDWIQIFSSGNQGTITKNTAYRVRAVRMVKI